MNITLSWEKRIESSQHTLERSKDLYLSKSNYVKTKFQNSVNENRLKIEIGSPETYLIQWSLASWV